MRGFMRNLCITLGACTALFVAPMTGAMAECGKASWYGATGDPTAFGEPFPTAEFTAAHKTAPRNAKFLVIRQDTGTSTVVRINDRGPYKRGRVIDLSPAAAANLKMKSAGLVKVCLYRLDRPPRRS